jgi:hypothetical protein
MAKIPYIIYEKLDESTVEYGSALESELQDILLGELKTSMMYHDFEIESDSDSESNNESNNESDLICDECECRVISNKYISVTTDTKLCSACSPSITINKGIFDRFMQFLEDKDEFCAIIYFKDNEWIKFTVI